MGSSVIGLGRLSLLITWSFIEINMLIIIPLLRFNYLFSPNSSLVLKYFLVQSIGSIILLIRLIFLFRFSDQKSLFLFIKYNNRLRMTIIFYNSLLAEASPNIFFKSNLFFKIGYFYRIGPTYVCGGIYGGFEY